MSANHDAAALLIEAMKDAPDPDTPLEQAVARLKQPFVLGDGKKWYYDGFIALASAVRQASALIDDSVSPDLPPFLLDSATYARFFGIPLENISWQGGRAGDFLRMEGKIDRMTDLLGGTKAAPATPPTLPDKPVRKWYKPGQWYHLPDESPPEDYKAGPLSGTRKQLSDWIKPGADGR